MTELPIFKLWAGEDLLTSRPGSRFFGKVYEIGLWLLPKPRSEQVEGNMVAAKFAARLRVALPSVCWMYGPTAAERAVEGRSGVVDSAAWTGGRSSRRLGSWRGFRISFWRWA